MNGKISLDKILLSERAVVEWQKVAYAKALKLARMGVDPRTIPDEEAEILQDGSLRIYVELPTGETADMIVPPQEWALRLPQN